MEILRVENLTKIYKIKGILKSTYVKAVENLSFSLSEGEVLGFFGPNCSGKTSTLKMLIGYSCPTKGRIEIFGKEVKRGDIEFRSQIGFLPENTFVPEYYKVEEFLEFCAALSGINKIKMRENIREHLKSLELEDKLNLSLGQLSMGQKRAVEVMQALVNNPKIIFLDEPTVYLDPLIVESFKSLIRNLKSNGHTIIISSHILSQMQDICDKVLIINKGERCAFGSMAELIKGKTLEELFLSLVR